MRCAVAYCENEGRHKFPKDEVRRKQWIEAIKHIKPKMNITPNSVICSDHFQLSDFSVIPTYWNNYYTGRIVSKTVVPSVFPWTKPAEVVQVQQPPPPPIQDTLSFNPKQVKATYSRVLPTVSVEEKNHTVSMVTDNSHKTKNILRCLVTDCKNEGRHKFPKDEVRRKQWIRAIKRVKPKMSMTISAHSLICSDHFRLSVFPWDKTSVEVTLEHPSSPTQIKSEQQSSPIQIKLEQPSSPVQVKLEQPSSPNQVEQSSFIQVKLEPPSSPIQVQLELPSSPIEVKLELPSSPIKVKKLSSSLRIKQLSSSVQVKLEPPSSPIQVQLELPSSPIQVQLEPPSSPIQVKKTPSSIRVKQPSAPIQVKKTSSSKRVKQPSSPIQVRQLSSPIQDTVGFNPSGQVKATCPRVCLDQNSTEPDDLKTKRKLRCVVADCKNRGRHRFPKDDVRRRQWIDAIKHVKPGKVVNSHSQICSDHFQISDFSVIPSIWNNYYVGRILRRTVVPSVFPWNNTSGDVKLEPSSSNQDSLNFNPDQLRTTYSRVPTVLIGEQNYNMVSTVTDDPHEDPLL